MKISEYVKKYTNHNSILLRDVLRETAEFIVEILKFNKKGISEEFSDVILFLQAWLWSILKIDGEVWAWGKKSADKFEARKEVWQNIYSHVGLKNIESKYLGNYNRAYKVVDHLVQLGIDEQTAKKAYKEIILKENL